MLDNLFEDKYQRLNQTGIESFAAIVNCICLLSASITVMTDEGEACPDCCELLILGLQVCGCFSAFVTCYMKLLSVRMFSSCSRMAVLCSLMVMFEG